MSAPLAMRAPRAGPTWRLWWLGLLLSSACVSFDNLSDVFPCGPDGSCSDGKTCSNGICVVPRPERADAGSPRDAGVDGGLADAGLDGGELDGGELDAGSDAGLALGPCVDLTEGPWLTKWRGTAPTEVVTTTLTSIDAGLRSGRAVRAVTMAAFDFSLQLTFEPPLDLRTTTDLAFTMRGTNTNMNGWQGAVPVVVLSDGAGARRSLTPSTTMNISVDGLTWSPFRVPLGGSARWVAAGTIDLSAVTQLELHVDTWGSGFTLDLDGVRFESLACSGTCPGGCGRGTCDLTRSTCVCPLGFAGPSCSACAPGFDAGVVDGGSQCLLPLETAERVWPNSVSRANSDPWLQVHHAEIRTMRPVVLALNFVNDLAPGSAQYLLERIRDAFAEASRSQGTSPVRLEYQLRPIVDLRDGVNGRPPPPPSAIWENSLLYPRRPAAEPGAWRFDYATLFEPSFAEYYGVPDPQNTARFLTLCELVNRGEINELWIIGSGDVPDVNAAEVLEMKPNYTATGNRIPNSVDRCAGNGCFDADVPFCGRSLKIAFVNSNRGPGCFLHSQGHGVEASGTHGGLPRLSAWFESFAGFDLDRRYGLPFPSWYQLSCTSPPCLRYDAPDRVTSTHAGVQRVTQPYDPVCGNVHFPPNATAHTDTSNMVPVRSSCSGFGRRSDRGADARALVDAASWSRFDPIAPDCGGAFMVYWFQNMPGYETGQTFTDGGTMLPIWPFLYY